MLRNAVWTDFLNAKFGDEYLILYISRQRYIRKLFKVVTVLLSAGGIWSAFNELKAFTVISCTAIGAVQLITSVETYIIHSEKDLDELCSLRLMYYTHSNKLEELWHNLTALTEDEIRDRFFRIREDAKKIEELDNKINVRSHNKLKLEADKKTRNYLKIYTNE